VLVSDGEDKHGPYISFDSSDAEATRRHFGSGKAVGDGNVQEHACASSNGRAVTGGPESVRGPRGLGDAPSNVLEKTSVPRTTE